MRPFYRALLRHRWLALLGLGLVTLAFLRFIAFPSRLLVDFSLDALLVPDAEARADLASLHDDFGDDLGIVGIVIALPRQGPDTVFARPTLAAIQDLGSWLRARPELEPDGVVSITDLPDLRAPELRPNALTASLASPASPASPNDSAQASLDAVGASLLAHRSYRGTLLSADAKATLVVAPFRATAPDLRKVLLDDLAGPLAALHAALPPGSEVHPVGVPLVQATYASLALRDIVLLVPLTILVIGFFLGLAFRRVYAVVGPLSGVGIATIWTLGLIQALGLPFDIVNSVAGVVILVVGVAEGAHIVARHREETARLAHARRASRTDATDSTDTIHPDDALEAILRTMDTMTPACFVTSATTAVGFASLASARLPAIVHFGLVLAAGVMMAWVIQMVLMPIVLSIARPSPGIRSAPSSDPSDELLGNGLFGRFLERVADRVLAAPRTFAMIGLVTAVVAGLGALRLHADARAAGELQSDHPVARGLATMEDRLSGVLVHAVVISGRATGTCASDDQCPATGPRSAPVCKRVDLAYRATSGLARSVSALTGLEPAALELLSSLDASLHDLDSPALGQPDSATPSAVIDGTCTEGVLVPEVMAFMNELAAWIDARMAADRARGHTPLISHTSSILDPLTDLGRGQSPQRFASPASLGESVSILESGAPALIGRFLTPDHTRTQLVLRANDIGLAAWRAFQPLLQAEIDRLVVRHGLTDRVSVSITGGSTLAEKAISGVAADLLDSVAYDFLLILAFIIGLVRSWRLGLLAMLPNLWPLIVTLGMMGFLDIPIRASTIIVFSVALGIAVDDTTHFVHRYREEVQHLGEGPEAIRRTILATGRPIVLTSVILVAGFLLNALSDFKAIVEFGVLSAITLGLALLADLLFTPAFLLLAKGRLGKL
jgi:predicted RND superfamily exporter protein